MTVAAGTFWALHVRQDKVNARFKDEYWYAPAIRWIVKYQNSRNWHCELTASNLLPPPSQ